MFRLAFELLAEGVPVWLDTWELGPGDPLISRLDSALGGSARVLIVVSNRSAATKRVKYEVQKTLEVEQRLGQRLFVPIKIDDCPNLGIEDRVYINLTDEAGFMDAIHT